MSPRSTARSRHGRTKLAGAAVLAAVFGLAVAAVAGAAIATASAEGPQSQPISVAVPPTPAIPPPLQTGPVPDLDLIFTAQVAGWVEPCG